MLKFEVPAQGVRRILLTMAAQIIVTAFAAPVYAQNHRPLKRICINVNIEGNAYFAHNDVTSNFLASQEAQIAAHFAQYIDAALDGRSSQNIKVSGESNRTNNSLNVINCEGEDVKVFVHIRPIVSQRGSNEVIYNIEGKRKRRLRFASKTSYDFLRRGPQDPYGGGPERCAASCRRCSEIY